MCVCVLVSVCVCERERERERDLQLKLTVSRFVSAKPFSPAFLFGYGGRSKGRKQLKAGEKYYKEKCNAGKLRFVECIHTFLSFSE